MFGLKNPFPKATETISGILIGKKESPAEPVEGTDKHEAEKDKEQEKEKKTKEAAAVAATKAKAAGSRPSSSSKSSGSAETYEQYLVGCVSPFVITVAETDGQVDSHAGYLAPAIKSLASSLDTGPITIGVALAVILLAIHLSLPIFMTPHFSALITLIIPLQSTVTYIKTSLHMPKPFDERTRRPEPTKVDRKTGEEKDEAVYEAEKKKWDEAEAKRKREKEVYATAKQVLDGGPQWIWYWIFYILVNGVRGLVGVYLPGWKGWYELWRSVVLVVVAGPWYAKAALMHT